MANKQPENICGECGGIGSSDKYDGLCKACWIGQEHGEGAKEAFLEDRARKGGKGSSGGGAPPGISKEFLPEMRPLPKKLRTTEDVQNWAEQTALAIAHGKIGKKVGYAICKCLDKWLDAKQLGRDDELRQTREKVEELREKVEEGRNLQAV